MFDLGGPFGELGADHHYFICVSQTVREALTRQVSFAGPGHQIRFPSPQVPATV